MSDEKKEGFLTRILGKLDRKLEEKSKEGCGCECECKEKDDKGSCCE
ncbi:MAG: hypothetical protein GF416_07005 [Candidatus Altiarchaeales archaeon]|nr:hypothetical protein [Candidatus Altiarchaeales archaeon]MBD3416861.1 hypothetical protein [Candidatus Altiarchaeales archaeon]